MLDKIKKIAENQHTKKENWMEIKKIIILKVTKKYIF